MTREEQIIEIGAQFAIDETDGQTSGRAASMRGVLLSAFRAGAHWADQHPQWIPVEERLPEDIGGFSDEVYVYCAERRAHRNGTGIYNFISNCWMSEFTDDEITHWMEIVPPRKEDKE